jgi:hypothetical protein
MDAEARQKQSHTHTDTRSSANVLATLGVHWGPNLVLAGAMRTKRFVSHNGPVDLYYANAQTVEGA